MKTVDLEEFDISFDYYGNLYFNFKNANYQINVDGKNNIVAEKGDYEILDENSYKPKLYSMIPVEKKILHKKINKQLQTEDEEEDYDEPHFVPEENDHEIEINESDEDDKMIDEDHIKRYGEQNKPFVFSRMGDDDFPIHNRRNGDIAALYDVYIYNNKNLMFKSKSKDNESIYIINIDPTNKMHFRQIGGIIKTYSIKRIDDEIFFV